MSDINSYLLAPFGVHYYNSSVGRLALGGMADSKQLAATTGFFTTANAAIFIPFRVMTPTRINKMFLVNGTNVAGNIDLGIYTDDGIRLTSNGGTAQSGPNTVQILSMSTARRVHPGQYYYMAVACSSSSAGIVVEAGTPAVALLQMMGMARVTSAYPLPATVTLAVQATDRQVIHFGFISEEA
jgi:hypothetical protein